MAENKSFVIRRSMEAGLEKINNDRIYQMQVIESICISFIENF